MKPLLFQFYDNSQIIYSINLEEAICEIYDAGVADDNLVLLYKANHRIDMAVKTPNRLSDRHTVNALLLQGDTWGQYTGLSTCR